MLRKAVRFSFDSFSILIFVLFINMLVLRYSFSIIMLLPAVILTGLSLRLFRFKRVGINIIFKILFAVVLYYVLSGIIFLEIPERILLAFYVLTVLFAGGRLYGYTQASYAFSSSFISLILSALMPAMLRKFMYEGLYLQTFVVIMISLNFIICFFRSNISEIMSISKTGHRIPRGLIISNRIMVTAAVVITVTAAFFREISAFVSSVGRLIKWLIRETMILIYRIIELLYGRGTDDAPPDNMGDLLTELGGLKGEESGFSTILTYVFYVILGIILLAALIFILIKLYGLAVRLLRFLSAYIEKDKGKNRTGYIDIVEKQKITEVTKEKIVNSMKAFIDEQKEKYRPKNTREEIRYLFKVKIRKMQKNGYRYDPSQTACEIYEKQPGQIKGEAFSREFTEAYNRARYSSGDIDDIVIDEIR